MKEKTGIIESIRISIYIVLIATAIDLLVYSGDTYFLYINHYNFIEPTIYDVFIHFMKNEGIVFLIKVILLIIIDATFLGKLVIANFNKESVRKQKLFFVVTWAALILSEMGMDLFWFDAWASAKELLLFVIVSALYSIVGVLTFNVLEMKFKNRIEKKLSKDN